MHKGKRKPKHETGNPREQRQEKLASAIQRIAFNWMITVIRRFQEQVWNCRI